jgi:geranylgeranyl diphosphate synthase type I
MDAENSAGERLIAAVDEVISEFIGGKQQELLQISPTLSILGELAEAFTCGGKRLRPAFCVWGYLAAAPVPDDPQVLLRAAASLDLLHVAELIHDDVMDASDTRRGQPSAHRQLQRWHLSNEWQGSPEGFGAAGAILLGDLLGKWSVELAGEGTASASVLQQLRTEVSAGQFLDIVAQATPVWSARSDPERMQQLVQQVVEYKTARYTVIRPLQLGATLGGGDRWLLEALQNYGSAIGRGFQYRDDILGVFGDPEVTGKPAGDDLREGKLTLLVVKAMELATEEQALQLKASLGRPDLNEVDIEAVREIMVVSGALDAVEAEIEECLYTAVRTIRSKQLRPAAMEALVELAYATLNRES